MGLTDVDDQMQDVAEKEDSSYERDSMPVIRIRHTSNGVISTPLTVLSSNGYLVNSSIGNRCINEELYKSITPEPSGGGDSTEEPLNPDREHHREQFGRSSCRNYLVLLILLVTNLINYMDRYVLAGVIPQIQDYYKVNNSMTGLLQTSFIISYMILSPIFGFLGDRYNRKYIMTLGILFWSAITLAGSFTNPEYFGLFLFMRALVGVGEASYSTIAPTIIADMYSKSSRTKALAVFYFAIPVGSGLGYIVGANVAKFMGCWVWALRVTPFLGFLCSVAILLVLREPPRGAADGCTHLRNTSVLSDVRYLIVHKSFMLSTAGFTCVSFVSGALAFWAPLYIYHSMRLTNNDADQATISLIFGVITCAAGISGVMIGSVVANKVRHVTPRIDPLLCGFGLIASAPFLYFALLFSKENQIVTWVLIFFGETLLSLNWALVADILLYTVIPTRRSMAEALQILFSHAFGDAGSPYLVGVVADQLKEAYPVKGVVADYIGLQYALYMACFVSVIGGGFFLGNAIYIREDRCKAELALKEGSGSTDSTTTSPSLASSSSDTITEKNSTCSSSSCSTENEDKSTAALIKPLDNKS